MGNRKNILIYTFVFIFFVIVSWLLYTLHIKKIYENRLSLASLTLEKVQADVAVFGTDWCNYCEKTRSYLESEGVKYYWIDIEKGTENKKLYDRFGASGVPLIITKHLIIEGYKINDLAKIKN
ncbi:MAG: glutaredoxin domain-containing protein [Flavobacteriaceae bacterium]|nr:glutaredoxin domain-containing protein [Flavobacteriaceae bacterium]